MIIICFKMGTSGNENQYRKLEAQYGQVTEELNALNNSYEELEASYKKAIKKAKNWKQKYDELKMKTERSTTETDDENGASAETVNGETAAQPVGEASETSIGGEPTVSENSANKGNSGESINGQFTEVEPIDGQTISMESIEPVAGEGIGNGTGGME